MRPLLPPTIHLNGTSKDELLNQLEAVVSALEAALAALNAAAPNGRDYYPQGPEALTDAQAAFAERARAVKQVHTDFSNLAWDIA